YHLLVLLNLFGYYQFLIRLHPLFSSLRFTRNSNFHPVDQPFGGRILSANLAHALQLEVPMHNRLTLKRAFEGKCACAGRLSFWKVSGPRNGRDDCERAAYKNRKAARRPFSRRCSYRGEVATGERQERK